MGEFRDGDASALSGELLRPPLLEGDFLLATTERYNRVYDLGLTYHGSPEELSQITAGVPYFRQGESWLPDSDYPVVCTTPEPAIAVFMAVKPAESWCAFHAEPGGGLRFFVLTSELHKFTTGGGFVSCLQKDENFARLIRDLPTGADGVSRLCAPEERTPHDQRPQFNIKVRWADFEQFLSGHQDAELVVVERPEDSFPTKYAASA